jgi:hypothetical protein
MNKALYVSQYSNPDIVLQRAKKLYGSDVIIDYSTRANKKYMIQDPKTKEWIHFGQLPFFDYTKTGDEIKRLRFQQRNHKWARAPKYSPAFMSYFILW